MPDLLEMVKKIKDEEKMMTTNRTPEPEPPIDNKASKKPEIELEKSLSVENTETDKKVQKTPKKINKSMFLNDMEYILDGSRYKVIIELKEKIPTRLKSAILQINDIKGYSNMTNEELDIELSKLMANSFLKILKGDGL